MGLSWQQGPVALAPAGAFLVRGPLPERMLYAEPLRRRMRVRLRGELIADSEDVISLHEPGRYPVAYFPIAHVDLAELLADGYVSDHPDLGMTVWCDVELGGGHVAQRSAWEHTALPAYAEVLADRVAFAWQAMDGFYEEDEQIFGHASDPYHRIDVRRATRHLVVQAEDIVIADTRQPTALYESGFAPRWYVPRADVDAGLLTATDHQTFCPYKGLCSYFDAAGISRAAWSYTEPYREADRIADHVSFEPDRLTVTLDGRQLAPEPGQSVITDGADRRLTPDEVAARPRRRAGVADGSEPTTQSLVGFSD